MAASSKTYAKVILPLPLDGDFTYIVPDELVSQVRIGHRVLVPFGSRHFYTGVVSDITNDTPPAGIALKEILSVLDEKPIVRGPQLRFWRWIADYYLCTVGDVFKAALPSGLKIESETRVEINEDAQPEAFADVSEKDTELLDMIRREGSCTVSVLEKKLGRPGVESTVGRLIERGLLTVSEKIVERYRVVKKPYLAPTVERGNPEALEAAFAAVKRSRKQEDALMGLIALSGHNNSGAPLIEVPLEVLCERCNVTRPIIKALADKGLCTIYYKDVSRFSYSGPNATELPTLSQPQLSALRQIHHQFREKDTILLHGVTGSGKTEIYIHLIDFVLKLGKQALFLVPEIALTTQLTRRLQKVFGNKVIIYHSKFSDNERVEIWRLVLNSHTPLVVIGARSSVFLPFANLGLVIVDEEHEPSYKQFEPAPRYNGRDAATVLASMHGAKTLYGSATPTVETYYKATTGKFGLVELSERFEGASLPEIEIVDMKRERKRKAVDGYFSHRLLEATSAALADRKQAIFFHNRRGYAPVARCKMCAFTPKCNYCDVALTYHRRSNRLVCHYCGAEYPVPVVCPECHEPAIEIIGYGTERLEEEIAENFKSAKVLRLDLDTTRNKDAYSRLIDEFSQHKADILVGTQMVTKGLDFGDVRVVGVLNADSLINFPDFRASERAFNMIEQVSGRAGRRDRSGRVIIQTYNPENLLIRLAASHNYLGFYKAELEERRAFGFPPFVRIINIYLKHRDLATTIECSVKLAAALREIFGNRVLGPLEPDVARVKSLFIRKIMLKVENGVSMSRVKELLREQYIRLSASPIMRGLSVYYDVDPV